MLFSFVLVKYVIVALL